MSIAFRATLPLDLQVLLEASSQVVESKKIDLLRILGRPVCVSLLQEANESDPVPPPLRIVPISRSNEPTAPQAGGGAFRCRCCSLCYGREGNVRETDVCIPTWCDICKRPRATLSPHSPQVGRFISQGTEAVLLPSGGGMCEALLANESILAATS